MRCIHINAWLPPPFTLSTFLPTAVMIGPSLLPWCCSSSALLMTGRLEGSSHAAEACGAGGTRVQVMSWMQATCTLCSLFCSRCDLMLLSSLPCRQPTEHDDTGA
jgi:hypothetical protein